MNFSEILSSEIQDYIFEKTVVDVSKLALQKNPFPNVDFKMILNQIESRNKSKEKLTTWYNAKNILYPSKISIEQTSSETTANYKSTIITGKKIIDLSGGFGVDAYYFSKNFEQVFHCEINDDLSKIVAHNFKQLNVSNIKCVSGDSLEILKNLNQNFDCIYIDPSRRNDQKGKVFMLKDCQPNVPDLQDFYYKFSNTILIKTAPILDIKAGLSELKNVKTIHIVAVENEVKELLWVIEKNYDKQIGIKTINFSKTKTETFNFEFDLHKEPLFDFPKKYLYEPNSAIMKSGGFNEISLHYSLNKLHQHSHLYTSNELIDFPGRIFEIEKIFEYSKKEMNIHLANKKANITTRNFPETVDHIRKKWKINDGGNQYCFFTSDLNDNKIVLLCKKITSK